MLYEWYLILYLHGAKSFNVEIIPVPLGERACKQLIVEYAKGFCGGPCYYPEHYTQQPRCVKVP
jgi:hypothetical protein